jgi:hypothetical protein
MARLIDGFAHRFGLLDKHSRQLLDRITDEQLFLRPRQIERSMTPFSCGEYIVRSGAIVEKTFGGITTRLWDDPFEWTLPESLVSVENVLGYLDEVEKTRSDGFGFFNSDDDLSRQIPSPEKLRTIFDVLLEAIAQAEHFQGRAYAIFQMLADETLPRIDR